MCPDFCQKFKIMLAPASAQIIAKNSKHMLTFSIESRPSLATATGHIALSGYQQVYGSPAARRLESRAISLIPLRRPERLVYAHPNGIPLDHGLIVGHALHIVERCVGFYLLSEPSLPSRSTS